MLLPKCANPVLRPGGAAPLFPHSAYRAGSTLRNVLAVQRASIGEKVFLSKNYCFSCPCDLTYRIVGVRRAHRAQASGV